MSTLSNAEKQKLLRERRQAKFKKSGESRLNKITSSNSLFASTKPAIGEGPPLQPLVNEAKPKNRANRISSILDQPPNFTEFKKEEKLVEDPEIDDIDTVEYLPAKVGNKDQDIFGQLLSNPGAFGAGGFGNLGDLGDLGDLGGLGAFVNQKDTPAQATNKDTYLSNQFKAKFALVRLFTSTLIVFYCFFVKSIRLYFSSSVRKTQAEFVGNKFYQYFLLQEMIYLSFFGLTLNSFSYKFQYDSVIGSKIELMGSLFLPPQLLKVLSGINKGYQFFSFFMLDISYLILLFVVLSFLAN